MAKFLVQPVTNEQVFIDKFWLGKFYLLVCKEEVAKLFLDKCTSFWTRAHSTFVSLTNVFLFYPLSFQTALFRTEHCANNYTPLQGVWRRLGCEANMAKLTVRPVTNEQVFIDKFWIGKFYLLVCKEDVAKFFLASVLAFEQVQFLKEKIDTL